MDDPEKYLAMQMVEGNLGYDKILVEVAELPNNIKDRLISEFLAQGSEDINLPTFDGGLWHFRYLCTRSESVSSASFFTLLAAMNFAIENNHL